MTDEQLEAFYESVVLPQFGIKKASIAWEASKRVGPDELAFRFSESGRRYILIFEDHFGLGRDPQFIERHLGLSKEMFTFVAPASEEAAENLPSYVGFSLPVPYQYCEGVTGTFTLLKIM